VLLQQVMTAYLPYRSSSLKLASHARLWEIRRITSCGAWTRTSTRWRPPWKDPWKQG
jgi:hypothetical protein